MKYKELLVIYILEILSENSNPEKRILQKDVQEILDLKYNISISRKTLGKYIFCLKEAGYIEGERGIYRVNKFSDNELRLLIDSILYAQYISAEEAKNIIDKLKNMSPLSLGNKIRNIHYVEAINRTNNDNLYPVLDNIDEAIEKQRQIRVTVCKHNINGELENVRSELIHPYYIVNSNSRYYLICYAGRENRLENRRIDRISRVEILEKRAHPLEDIIGKGRSFDLGQYMQEHIYMFSGDSLPIRIRMLKEHIGFFIEWYGSDYRIVEEDEDYVTVRVISNENATYYWALQYGNIVEVVEPISLRNRIKEGLKDILNKYE